MSTRRTLLFSVLLLVPTALSAQASEAAPLRPLASLAVPSAFACSSECRPATLLTVPSPAPVRKMVQDTVGMGRTGVVWGAAIGGLLGGAAIATYTLWDNQKKPPTWWEALAAPIAGAIVGAGVGLLF